MISFLAKKKELSIICFLFILAFAVRLLFLSYALKEPVRYLTPDSNDYLVLAQNLYDKFLYFNSSGNGEIFRIPGYSFFIYILWFFVNKSIICILLFQIFIDSLSCLLTWKISKELFKDDLYSSYIAFLFQIFSIVSIVFSVKILSETLFTFLLLVVLLLAIKTSRSKGSLYFYIFGFFTAVLCLVRAIGIPLIFLFLFVIYFRTKSFSKLLNFIIPLLLLLGFWSTRNYIQTNYFGLSTVSKINLYRYNACALLAKKNNSSFLIEQKKCDKILSNYKTQKEKADYSQQKGIETIIEHPFKYLLIHTKSCINTLLPAIGDLYQIVGIKIGNSGTLAMINSYGIVQGIKSYFNGKWILFFISLPLVLVLFIKYILSLFSCILITIDFSKKYIANLNSKSVNRKSRSCGMNFNKSKFTKPKEWACTLGCISNIKSFNHIILFMIILYFLFAPGPASTPRFRVPIAPLLSIYAGNGLVLLFNLLRKKPRSGVR